MFVLVAEELYIVQLNLPHLAAGLRKASGWPLTVTEAERFLGLSGFDHLDDDLWLCSHTQLQMLEPGELIGARPLR